MERVLSFEGRVIILIMSGLELSSSAVESKEKGWGDL